MPFVILFAIITSKFGKNGNGKKLQFVANTNSMAQVKTFLSLSALIYIQREVTPDIRSEGLVLKL
jgi:hypothetical protein